MIGHTLLAISCRRAQNISSRYISTRQMISLCKSPTHQYQSPLQKQRKVVSGLRDVSAIDALLPSMTCSRSFSSTSSSNEMIAYNLADIGEGIAEAEVLQWFVEEGEYVEEFSNLVEVQSDKATVEITSRYSGVVKKLHHKVGDMAKVGAALCDIEVEGEGDEAPPSTPAAKEQQQAQSTSNFNSNAAPPVTKSDRSKSLASPAVRRVAKENNIDLLDVNGSGKEGRVLKGDLFDYLDNKSSASTSTTVSTLSAPSTGAAAAAQDNTQALPKRPIPSDAKEDKIVPVRGVQRLMVKSMNAANQIPHFTYADELVVNKLVEFRKQFKPIAQQHGINFSYLPLFLKALSLGLRQHPHINAIVNEDCTEVTHKADHNIAIAMDTPNGLIVPVVKYVQKRSLLEIAQEINELQVLAKAGKLTQEHLTGGTISLSNIGSVGGTYMSPVLVVPQVAIGALGKFQTVPRFDEDGDVVSTTICNISWSGDHRVVDGASMAQFSNTVKNYIENPETMLLHLA